jgi:outer membrane protein OmpA-like peptidoglycan-associated protein
LHQWPNNWENPIICAILFIQRGLSYMRKVYLLSFWVLMLCAHHAAFSQHAKELSPGYYVVVAAFSPDREDLAVNYTKGLTDRGMGAKFGFNSERNYYYVFVKFFPDREPSLQEMRETRKQEEFSKAWVRKVSPYRGTPATATAKVVEPEVTKEEIVAAPVKEEPPAEVTPPVVTPLESIIVTDNPDIVQFEHMDLDNTEVFLSLFNATNNRVVEGKVKVIDTEKAKLLKEVDGNDYLYLPNPKSQSGQITLICEAFGYRKVQQEINYPLPLADTAKSYVDLVGTTFIVYFDLVRYNKGDIATLYQVFFYNDAAIMLPESKFELNSLLQMMQENPSYRIRLHGHTNGNYHGKIIVMGSENKFFSLDGSRKTSGSAKDLSRERAEIIKDYLVANGIDASRVEVRAWGGKRPLYDKHSANAKRNVRVEVEIVEDK